jgi:hypothetical protein
VEGVDDRVDLNAVAGRQHHHLGDVAAAQHLVEQLWNFVGRDRHPLQQLDRRAAVRQAHHKHIHGDHLPLFAGGRRAVIGGCWRHRSCGDQSPLAQCR